VNYLSILEPAANFLKLPSVRPPASEVLAALLTAERISRKEKPQYSLEQLLGTWRLCLTTGTSRFRSKTNSLGATARYLPQFIKIELTYTNSESLSSQVGRVENCVTVAGLKLTLNGPVRFLTPKNILVFDFTSLKVSYLGFQLYEGYIRGGKAKENDFYRQKISKQAFFVYFLLTETAIAARGKGGGLALWSRVNLD
jgi:hypothetical protein